MLPVLRRSAPFLVLLALLAGAPAAYGQDQAELKRLAGDQRKLADQARRLDDLLQSLEEREREAGHGERADLLAGARARLGGAGSAADLLSLLEGIAGDLAEMRAGIALEQQAKVIEELEALLKYLLDQQRMEQLEAALGAAQARREALEEMARLQRELLAHTEGLEESEQSRGEADGETRAGLAEAQRELNARIEDFAQDERAGRGDSAQADAAAEAGREAAELLDPEGAPRNGEEGPGEGRPETERPAGEARAGERSDEGEPAGEDASGEPPGAESGGQRSSSEGRRAPPEAGENLREAQDAQERALDALEDAARQARREEQKLQDLERKEALLDLVSEAVALLERHQAVMKSLRGFAAENPDGRPGRRARVQLRQWSSEEAEVSRGTGELLLEVRKQGADSVPFLLSTLEEDHRHLAEQLGSPRYEAGEAQVAQGERLVALWQELVDALRAEAMRERPPLEEGARQQEGEQQEPPLVSLAAEVQLLMRMESQVQERIGILVEQRRILSLAGIELDESDLRELDQLIDRQSRLRSLFESIVKRLESGPDEGKEEEA